MLLNNLPKTLTNADTTTKTLLDRLPRLRPPPELGVTTQTYCLSTYIYTERGSSVVLSCPISSPEAGKNNNSWLCE